MRVRTVALLGLVALVGVGATTQVPGPVYKEDTRFPLVGLFTGVSYPMMNGAREDAKVFVAWGGPNREWITSWDLQTGELKSQKHVLRMSERLQVPELSPSGKYFFQPSVDKASGATIITYLDSQTGQTGKTASFDRANPALTKIPGSTQDERFLVGKYALAGLLSGGKPQGWPQKGLPAFRGSPTSLPEDGRYAVATDPMFTRLYLVDVDKFKVTMDMPLPPLGEYVNQALLADISADGRSLALRMAGNVLGIVDVPGKKVVKELKGHSDEIVRFRISRDGAKAVSIGKDRAAKFWDAKSGAELASHRTEEATRLGHSQDVFWIQERDGTVRTYTAGGALVGRTRTQLSHRAAISRSGEYGVDVVERGSDASLAFWKLNPPRLLGEHALDRGPEAVWISPDGRYAFSRRGADLWVFNVPEDKEVWSGKTAKGMALGLLPDAKGVVLLDGAVLSAVAFGSSEPIWRQELKSKQRPRGFNFCGKYLAFAADLPVVIDLSTGEPMPNAKYPASMPGLEEVFVSDDGRTVVTLQPGSREVSWWSSEGELTKTCTLDPAARFQSGRSFSLAPDGSRAFISVPERILTVTPDGTVATYQPFVKECPNNFQVFGEMAALFGSDYTLLLRCGSGKSR